MKRLTSSCLIIFLIIFSSCTVALHYPQLNLVPAASIQKQKPEILIHSAPATDFENIVIDSSIKNDSKLAAINNEKSLEETEYFQNKSIIPKNASPEDSTKKIEAWGVGAFAASVAVFCLPKPFSNGYSYLLAAIALGLALLSFRRFNKNPEKYKYRIFANIAMIVGLALTTFLVLMLLQTLISGAL